MAGTLAGLKVWSVNPAPAVEPQWGRGWSLSAVVMMVVVTGMTMVMRGGEGRAGKDHQEQGS